MNSLLNRLMYRLMALVNFRRDANFGDLVLDFVEDGDRLLDLGGRTGDIAEYIDKKKKVKITLLDLTDGFSQTKFPIKVYDGKKIPFDANQFNCVLLSFVLHHSDDSALTLREAVRVTKEKIIIFEDIYEDRLGLFLTQTWDRLVCFLGGGKGPFSFKKDKQWRKEFKKLGLRTLFAKEIRFPFYRPTKQKCYVLSKK